MKKKKKVRVLITISEETHELAKKTSILNNSKQRENVSGLISHLIEENAKNAISTHKSAMHTDMIGAQYLEACDPNPIFFTSDKSTEK